MEACFSLFTLRHFIVGDLTYFANHPPVMFTVCSSFGVFSVAKPEVTVSNPVLDERGAAASSKLTEDGRK